MDNSTSNSPSPSQNADMPWVDNDRRWFAKNTHRNFRLRAASYVELTQQGIFRVQPGIWNGIIVNQIAPGARTRTSFVSFGGSPENTDAKAIEIITICDANRSGD